MPRDNLLCVFCEIISGRAPAQFRAAWDDAVAFHPLGPVTEGHILVVPRKHVDYVGEDPEVSALTMRRAAEIASQLDSCNIITSQGVPATQSVFHLHLHVVPRRPDDGLHLPWRTGPAGI